MHSRLTKTAFLILWVFCTFFKSNPTYAQSSTFGQFYLDQWDTDDGLPVDLILSLKQTKEGFIWLRTYNGLIRFDGVSFKTYDSRNVPFLTNDNINAILETEDSTLWVSSPFDGIWKYKDGETTLVVEDCNPASRLYWNESTGNLLFSDSDQEIPLKEFNLKSGITTNIPATDVDSHFISLMVNNDIKGIGITDSNGYKWWINNNTVYRSRNGIFETVLVESSASDLYFFDIDVDSKNRVWLASSRGIYTYTDGKLSPYPGMETAQSLPVSTFRGQDWILEDKNGGIWVVLFNNIAYLAPNSQYFEMPPEEHPLRSMLVTSLESDHEGNIWFSSQGGLARLSQNIFTTYSRDEGLKSQQVEAVTFMGIDRYLIATINGDLSWNNKGVISPFSFKEKLWNNLSNNFYYMFTDSKGNIWGCSRLGVFKITEKEELWIARNISVRYVFEDHEGELWFVSPNSGVGKLNENGEIDFMQFDSIDFNRHFTSSIRRLRDGTLLITTFNLGLKILDPNGNLVELENDKDLSKTGVFTSYLDEQDNVWFPSQTGLYRLKDGKVDRLDYDSGIPAISVFNMIPDTYGNVWLTSNFGIIKASKKELDDYLDGEIQEINWRLFDDGDGMRSRSCTGARHCAVSPDGKILVPTLDGVVEIIPSKVVFNTVPPPVIINQFLWDDLALGLNEKIELEPGNHRFVFGYSGLSYKAPEKVQFKFHLEGYDKDWIDATGDRRAIYTSLPRGHYIFRVKACNNDGVWNEIGDSVSFTILPPWWHRSWAYGLYAISLLLGLYLFDRLQKKRILRKQELIAKENELKHAREIQKAYAELEESHQNLKSTQAQLIQSEKMASLGELTAGIAHEIQNPLNFVNNFSEVSYEMIDEANAEMEKGDVEEVKHLLKDLKGNLQKITHHGKRADSIVKGMLLHSRATKGEKIPTDINALCDEFLRLSYHGLRARDRTFNADFKTDFDETLPKINVIPQDIGRVMLNLFNNAFQAISDRADRSVSTAPEKPLQGLRAIEGVVKVSTKNLGDKIQITISDNGPGIPNEIKDKIFEPFFTTKPTGQGTGLGLSLAYDIVKAHGGNINIESNKNIETTFTIVIPNNQ